MGPGRDGDTEGVSTERTQPTGPGAAVTRNPLRSHVVHSLLAPSLRVPHGSLTRYTPSLTSFGPLRGVNDIYFISIILFHILFLLVTTCQVPSLSYQFVLHLMYNKIGLF